MLTQKLLNDVLALPPDDRLELIARLWDSLRDDSIEQELDRRYVEFLENPAEGSSWDEVEAFVRARLRS